MNIICKLELTVINLHTKLEVPSFIQSEGTEKSTKFQKVTQY